MARESRNVSGTGLAIRRPGASKAVAASVNVKTGRGVVGVGELQTSGRDSVVGEEVGVVAKTVKVGSKVAQVVSAQVGGKRKVVSVRAGSQRVSDVSVQNFAGTRGVAGALVQPSLGLEAAAALVLKHRLPAISFRRHFVEAGGLLSYGSDQAEINRAVAAYVDRLLKGARVADLPVVQTSKTELVVNQKTARALGFVFPPLFLARVDEVIE